MKQYLLILVCGFLSCNAVKDYNVKPSKPIHFYPPAAVAITGYSGDVMEPFISRDGKYLFFNNLNDPAVVNTNIFYAVRVNDTAFNFAGEVAGVNTPALDAVASMDNNSNFYFISTRSYDNTLSTIYAGKYSNGAVTGVDIVRGISKEQPGMVNFDAEISPDGNTLYFADGRFSSTGQLEASDILFAVKDGSRFRRPGNADDIMKNINNGDLQYAPCTSPDGLTLFFTRVHAVTPASTPAIFYATRSGKEEPFSMPAAITEIDGFAEAPSLCRGDSILYYHKMVKGHFALSCIKRR